MRNKGIAQFYLLRTHEPYLSLLPSHKVSLPFDWYSLRLPTKGWPGWVGLGGWLHTVIIELNLEMVTHPRTNRAQGRLTSLIETNVQPLRQTTTNWEHTL